MRLNEKGWGLNTLLIVGSIFIVILLFVSITIKNFISRMKEDNKSNQTVSVSPYETLENNLKKSGESYVSYHNTLVTLSNESLTISFDQLHDEGYIDNLYNEDTDENCTGYVIIYNDGTVKPYIKCINYVTEEYYDWID